jgi:hypothetical protein
MRYIPFFLLALVSVFGTSCSNEIDINAPYKETMVVFGLLNKDETTHYVRINKAFLGEGDALQFAAIADSINYAQGVIDAKVDEVVNGNVTRTFTLEPVTDIAKDNGIFSNPYQVIYKFETSSGQGLNLDADYKLRVKNNATSYEISSETNLVGQVILSSPGINLPAISLFPQAPTTVKFKSAKNGKLYEVFVYFKYREYNINTPQDITEKSVLINLGRTSIDNTNAGKEITSSVANSVIYQTIANNISESTSTNPMVRLADSLRFEINAASEPLETYLNINQPSNSLAQERPVYGNIENGVGLFSSRATLKRSFYLNDASVDSLKNNFATNKLGFLPR